MGFSFSHRSKVGSQVRKIAAEQIDAALDDIATSEDFDDTVHELRRHCKKIRGLLRLVRPNFPDFAKENAAYRGAADALSASRDAAVMLETFDALFKDESTETRNALRNRLEDNVRRVSREQDRTGLLDSFAEAMTSARQRVKHWTFDAQGFALIEPGLHDTYARMQKRFKAAEKTGEDEDFHEWRKETKGHWFQVSLFKDCAPDRLGARKDQLDTLGEYLGDHHNLAVLTEGLEALAGPLDRAVTKAIARRKDDLAQKAFALGRQLSVDSPTALVTRFEKFWKLLPKDD
ncbi:CHAD domain-containing protein [Devosia sp.]|uniref:CHAD domain-containing protein n=1 Tax=Devosia sp. TaxID=1871048 RepID=UPI001B170E50|nr:CHAD domain-containing protein [Devosia sp.]MBO9587740.1 CHAD domain-containing protein [Devosia sp.]